MTAHRKRGRPRGSRSRKGQEKIAFLEGGWKEKELVFDPKLRDSKGHLKRWVKFKLDKEAGYK